LTDRDRRDADRAGLHDGRLLTRDDTVELFSLVLELKVTAQEKADLVAFLRAS